MQVQDIGRAGSFVQIIHILGDDLYLEFLLQKYQGMMGCVGLHLGKLLSALIQAPVRTTRQGFCIEGFMFSVLGLVSRLIKSRIFCIFALF